MVSVMRMWAEGADTKLEGGSNKMISEISMKLRMNRLNIIARFISEYHNRIEIIEFISILVLLNYAFYLTYMGIMNHSVCEVDPLSALGFNTVGMFGTIIIYNMGMIGVFLLLRWFGRYSGLTWFATLMLSFLLIVHVIDVANDFFNLYMV